MNQIVLDLEPWEEVAFARRRPREPERYRWTARQVLEMSEAGLFGDRRVELIDGEIFHMPDEGELHQGLRTRIQNTWVIELYKLMPGGYVVSTNGPIRLAEEDEPEPDIYIFPAELAIGDVHGPESLLIVEIAVTSHAHDFSRKAPQYSRFGTPEVWIIDALNQLTTVHRGPDGGGGWLSITRHGAGDTLSPLAIPELRFRLVDHLPPDPETV